MTEEEYILEERAAIIQFEGERAISAEDAMLIALEQRAAPMTPTASVTSVCFEC